MDKFAATKDIGDSGSFLLIEAESGRDQLFDCSLIDLVFRGKEAPKEANLKELSFLLTPSGELYFGPTIMMYSLSVAIDSAAIDRPSEKKVGGIMLAPNMSGAKIVVPETFKKFYVADEYAREFSGLSGHLNALKGNRMDCVMSGINELLENYWNKRFEVS